MCNRSSTFATNMLTTIFFFAVLTVGWTRMREPSVHYAVCNLRPSSVLPNNITGTIYFRQTHGARKRKDNYMQVQVDVDNVSLLDNTIKHGFHVHEFGDTSAGCPSMGPHYNPRGTLHGDIMNQPTDRHVGDWGNLQQDPVSGKIKVYFVDYLTKLHGPESILGRGVVLHAGQDDLGVNKTDPGSTSTGNSGARLACCVIARSAPIPDDKFMP